MKIPCISSIHNNHEYGIAGIYGYKLTKNSKSVLTFPSKFCKGIHLNKGTAAKRDNIIHNLILVPKQSPLLFEGQALFMNAARFVEGKNQQILLQAFAELNKDFTCLKMVFFGEGPLLAKHKDMTLSLGLCKNVFYRNSSNRDTIYRSAPVFVNASVNESFGLSIGEALAYGQLVISVPNPTLKECFGKGIIFARGSTAKALAETMRDILQIPKKRFLRQRKKNQVFIKNKFSPKRIADQWEQLYHKQMAL